MYIFIVGDFVFLFVTIRCIIRKKEEDDEEKEMKKKKEQIKKINKSKN